MGQREIMDTEKQESASSNQSTLIKFDKIGAETRTKQYFFTSIQLKN